MNNKLCRMPAVGMILLGWNGIILAEGVQITPGKWETTTVAKMPMMSEERVEKFVDCIAQTEFTPEDLLKNNEAGCGFSDISVRDNTMSWKMECASSGTGKALGHGEFTSEGDTAHGAMRMEMTLNGESMAFETHWEGQRIGECD